MQGKRHLVVVGINMTGATEMNFFSPFFATERPPQKSQCVSGVTPRASCRATSLRTESIRLLIVACKCWPAGLQWLCKVAGF